MLNQKGIAFIPILIWSVAILLTGTAAVKQELIKVNLSGNGPLIQGADVIPTPSSISTTSPEPTPRPTYIPKKKEVYLPKPTIDPDPVTECQNSNCGSIRIKKSLCSNTVGYVCCQVGNAWTWYASRNKCKQDQDAYLNNTIARPSINPNSQPSFDWSTYRAARIKTLKGSLSLTNDLISRYENDLAKIAFAVSVLAEDYQQGKVSTGEFNRLLDEFEKQGDTIAVELTSLRTEREKVTILIKRFEAGENISPAEDKAILGY